MGRKYGKQDILTTGEVAKICNVAPRTVSKWFDNGQLRGYRIPGSRDRRIPLDQLMRFMKAHGMPIGGLETGQTRLLIIDSDADLTDLLRTVLSEQAGYDVRTATSGFEAGAIVDATRKAFAAHAPTLAAAYLDYLSRSLGHRAAARDLCRR